MIYRYFILLTFKVHFEALGTCTMRLHISSDLTWVVFINDIESECLFILFVIPFGTLITYIFQEVFLQVFIEKLQEIAYYSIITCEKTQWLNEINQSNHFIVLPVVWLTTPKQCFKNVTLRSQ